MTVFAVRKKMNLFRFFDKEYKKCTICGKRSYFTCYGCNSPIFEKYNMSGGGYRENVTCQYCGANDRVRYVDFIISRYTDIYSGKNSVLHIAPEKSIESKIRKNEKCEYITGDLDPNLAEIQVDVTNMQFNDKSFDYIIMNHVFEHINDEKKAISEIKRCLKNNGKLIFSIPVNLDEKTFEDSTLTSVEDRINYYGQSDHVRLYGYDYIERFENFGIKITEYIASNILTKRMIEKYNVQKTDRVCIATK